MAHAPSRLRSLVAGVLMTSAAGVATVTIAAPAEAAACTTTTGVTVIADFNELGGVSSVCVADGAGKTAAALFDDAGLTLRYATRQPGFVCRVVEKPASDPCVNTSPASAYWSLWWSDGDAGSGWTYSSLGVLSLEMPAGGVLAFSWDQVDGDEQPSAASSRPAPAPAPTPAPGSSPAPAPAPPSGNPTSGSGSGQGGVGGQGGTADPATPAPSAGTGPDSESPSSGVPTDPSATGAPGKGPGEGPGQGSGKGTAQDPDSSKGRSDRGDIDPSAAPDPAGETPDADADEAPAADPAPAVDPQDAAAGTDGGLPVWTAPALIVLLFGAAGVAWWGRRRGAGQS